MQLTRYLWCTRTTTTARTEKNRSVCKLVQTKPNVVSLPHSLSQKLSFVLVVAMHKKCNKLIAESCSSGEKSA